MSVESELLNEIVAKITELHGKAASLKGKDTFTILSTILTVLPDVIKEVEVIGGKLDSADKKELAIEVMLKWANIKKLPDSMERQILSLVIDLVIALLNKWFGKEWIKKVTSFLGKVWYLIKKVF